MQLTQIIIKRIRESGPISFHDFMETALYYPRLGYYTSQKNRIGKQGDYYTSPVLSSLYGQMIAKQVEEMWNLMDQEPFSVVEYGAGSGALCCDILDYLKNNEDLYRHLNYYIIERNGLSQQTEQRPRHPKAKFICDIEETGGINGCVLSNELLDNFSIHAVIMKDELMEVFVDYKNDEFTEVLKPASGELKNYFLEQNIILAKEYRTEINLQALEWIEKIAANLRRGFVMTIDYGYTAGDLYSISRNTGTLACYYQHCVSSTPYLNVGQQDITAHVNFSALNTWGKKYGLDYAGFCNQNYFLRSMGIAHHLRKTETEISYKTMDPFSPVNKLLLEMGSNFKVLIQQKGIQTTSLTGMQFSRQFL